jgi:hypothetical protein
MRGDVISLIAVPSEDALQYRLQYEAPELVRGLYPSLTFHLQIYTF